ncbi:MAG TPA: enoyl-CoA hydratase/isomerase family protein [Solirubrobacter sp.]|nr:enoyl-CoA hydratase/isomerase family protein [Solirubrobacter sp.]
MPELVVTEDREAVRHVILDRPEKRNALNQELVLGIRHAFRAAADDPAVRVVVVRGNGPVFSAGMDVAALAAAAGAPERLRAFRRACLEAWNLAEEMTKPVVCVIHGVCLGGALELALACDLRILADDAQVGLPETRLGLVPDLGGSSRLPQVVGVGRAKELILTGRVIGAADAERFGLANRVAPATDLEAATHELTQELLGCAPLAVGLAKRLVDASARPALSTTLELEIVAQEQCARSEDVKEGVRAAAERRAPQFRGR